MYLTASYFKDKMRYHNIQESKVYKSYQFDLKTQIPYYYENSRHRGLLFTSILLS